MPPQPTDLRAAFFGTPEWAIPSLEALASAATVVGVVTNPDRPSGRGHDVNEPPIKPVARRLELALQQPTSARDDALAAWLTEIAPDVAVVVAYGKILPASLLAIPRLGFVNLHFSLLPQYRGAAPVQHAVLDGQAESGVSIMVLNEGMDEGPVLSQESVAIGPQESAGELGARLASMGADLLVTTLDAYARGEIAPQPQNDELATYAPKLTTDQALIDWELPASRIHDLVRAFDPAPGAWSEFRGARIKIYSVEVVPDEDLDPGRIRWRDGLWLVGTGSGSVSIVEAQVSGKKRMTGPDIARGLRPTPADHFGQD